MNLRGFDKMLYQTIKKEAKRQEEHIELIASENFVSKAVLEAQGSILTNKYAEGYPGKRYYGGCEVVDAVEQLAIDRVKQLFQVAYANVQPHSGSQANMAAFLALVKPGDRVLGMSLNDGGHLTHGHHLSFSGIYYEPYFYNVNKETELLDYEKIRDIALEVKPKLIIAGASAYSRVIDFKKFRDIADEVGAYLMVDMAHIAGLVAAKIHPSPMPYADVVTSTTHKTLRGPRGGIILTNSKEIAKKIDRSVFPGVQGGPLMHVIAAKAVAFKEALEPAFIDYQQRVVDNAKQLAKGFIDKGYRVISQGTDNHLLLIDVKSKFGLTGLQAEKILGSVHITLNKNSIPYDEEKPMYTSGIRIGTPAVTSRGLGVNEMNLIVDWIDEALSFYQDVQRLKKIKQKVKALIKQFKMPSSREK